VAIKKTSRQNARPRPKKAAKPAGRVANGRPPAPIKKAVRPAPPAKPVLKKPAPKPAAGERTAPPPVPNAMGLESLHVDYTSLNLEEVRRFYTQQLGFTKFTWDPQWGYLWVQTSNGSSLGFMPPVQGAPPMLPREPNLYFLVADVDEAYRKLQTRGVSFEGPPEDKPWGHRVLITRDPEGRSIWIAQPKRK
jgi:predicted enzyme related to lactoylglutathione lyase